MARRAEPVISRSSGNVLEIGSHFLKPFEDLFSPGDGKRMQLCPLRHLANARRPRKADSRRSGRPRRSARRSGLGQGRRRVMLGGRSIGNVGSCDTFSTCCFQGALDRWRFPLSWGLILSGARPCGRRLRLGAGSQLCALTTRADIAGYTMPRTPERLTISALKPLESRARHQYCRRGVWRTSQGRFASPGNAVGRHSQLKNRDSCAEMAPAP